MKVLKLRVMFHVHIFFILYIDTNVATEHFKVLEKVSLALLVNAVDKIIPVMRQVILGRLESAHCCIYRCSISLTHVPLEFII